MRKYLIILLVSVFISYLPIKGFPAEGVSSEIININVDQRVVFIDIGNDVLSAGDVLKVEGSDHPIYLEVVEATDTVSKLRASKNEKYYSDASEIDSLTIGMKVTRVLSTKEEHATTQASVQSSDQSTPSATTIAALDPQVFVKPDITKESIQGIIDRMSKMADANVKLSSALAQCQAAEGESEKQNAGNIDLKKQLDDINAKLLAMTDERDKYKKQSEDLNLKLDSLKKHLDHLDSILGGQ